MKSQKSKVNILGWLAFILIPLPAIWGLIHTGFFDPHDMHHLADIYEMFRAFLSGQLPPRLGPDFSFGYTYPLFNYYYLLPFYLGSLLYWLFGSLTLSFKLVLIISVLISYGGMYKFLRLHFNKLAATIGAALFIYTPYRAVQIYVRGSLGEMLALSLLPWVLYFVGKYLVDKDNKYISFGSLTFLLLVISHNYFFALFLPLILIYAYVNSRGNLKSSGGIRGVLLMIVLGIGSASYWLIPGLLEKNLVRGETPFKLSDHFPFIRQLIIPSWGYGSSVWGPTDEISFQIGLINVFAILMLGYIYAKIVIKKGNLPRKWLYGFTLLGFMVSFLFMNIRTLPLWRMIPYYDLIQFPWRLLNFTTFFSAIALAACVEYLRPDKQKLMVTFSLGALLMVSNLYFHPNKYFYKTDSEYLELFFNNPSYSEDYLLLPKWVSKRPDVPFEALFESDNAEIVGQGRIGLLGGWANIVSSNETQVTANVYYFPGWRVNVEGKDVDLAHIGEFGKIGFMVPAGNSKIVLKWTETPLRKTADIISLAFVTIIVILYFKKSKLESV